MLKTYESGNGNTITFDPSDLIGLERSGANITVTLKGFIILMLNSCESSDLVDVYKAMVTDWEAARDINLPL